MANLYPGYDPRTAVLRNKENLYSTIRSAQSTTNLITLSQHHQAIHKYYANIMGALKKASEHEGQPVHTAVVSLEVWSEEYERFLANPSKFIEEFF